MRGYMFKHRWLALIFVCLTAYGAVSLIGTSDEDGMLIRAAEDIAGSRKGADSQSAIAVTPPVQPIIDNGGSGDFSYDDEDEFVEDESSAEPSDSGEGFEPSPDFDPDMTRDSIAASDDIVIIVPDGEIEQ